MGTADTTTVDYGVVGKHVSDLKTLVDSFMDTVQPSLTRLGEQQNTYRWTNLPECAAFRSQYAASIGTADGNLRAVWGDIATFALNLKAAADALSTRDDEVHQMLQDILTRLDAGTEAGYGLTPDNATLTWTGTTTTDVKAVGQSGV